MAGIRLDHFCLYLNIKIKGEIAKYDLILAFMVCGHSHGSERCYNLFVDLIKDLGKACVDRG